MPSHRAVVVLLAAGALVVACDEQADPVSVPFKGLDAGIGDSKHRAGSATGDGPDGADAATPRVGQPVGGLGQHGNTAGSSGGGIDGCCAALSAAAKATRNAKAAESYRAAVSYCGQNSKLVREGKISRSEALTRIRASLIGRAPTACR